MKTFCEYLKEQSDKSIAFTFGRFQPPTIGHEKLFRVVADAGRHNKYMIVASHSTDQKVNLLPWGEKIAVLKEFFPEFASHFSVNPKYTNIIDILKGLSAEQYVNVTMVVGSDRVAKFKDLVNTYNGKDYNIPFLEVISAGERDPDDDGASGASSSKARAAAVEGNFREFCKMLPKTATKATSTKLFELFRKSR